jgi:hypothetical protein
VVADQARLISEGTKIGVDIDGWEILFDVKDTSEVLVTEFERSNRRPPVQFILIGVYPNPFNSATKIVYEVASYTNIKLAIYDTLGRPVMTLLNEKQSPGRKEVTWNGRDNNGTIVASGVYFIRLASNTFATIKKVVLIR